MRVAISTDGDFVSAHFGRCPSFTIVNIEDGKIKNKEVVDNPGHQPGFIPQFLHQKGVECIVAGGMGMRAQQLFAQQNIRVVIGAPSQTPADIAQAFLADTLQTGPNLCDH